MAETATAPMNGVVAPDPVREAQADGARAIFDALTEKAREREISAERNVAARRVEQDAQAEERKSRIRDAKGRFVIEMPTSNKPAEKPKAKVEPVAAPKAITESPVKAETNGKTGVTEEPEADDGVTADDKEKALTALIRAKVPKGVREGMKAKDWTKWGLELAEIQSNTDRITKEHRDLKKHADEEAKKPKVETRTEGAATTATASADLDGAIKAFDDAGPEFGKALRAALAIKDQIAEVRLSERDKLIKGLSDELNGLRIEGLLATARTELRDRFPGLRIKDRFKSVLGRMDRITADPEVRDSYAQKYEDPLERMTACMEDSCNAEFRDDLAAQELSDAKETDRKRLGGQLTPPGRTTQATTEPIKGKDRGEQIYWLMAGGLTAEEARARVDGLR